MEYNIKGEAEATHPEFRVTLSELKAAFMRVPDPRRQNGRLTYPLWLMLLAATAALLAGQVSVLGWAEWLAAQDKDFKLKLGFEDENTPVQSTFQRLWCKLSPAALEEALRAYFDPKAATVLQRGEQAVAIDGKCQRGRNKFAAAPMPVHLISLFCHELGTVLAQCAVETGTNEVSSAPHLLAQIDWEGRVLTGDAAYCQREICKQVVEAGGDYLFVVKGNQKTLQSDIADVFDPSLIPPGLPFDIRISKSVDKGHGRIEIRQIQVSNELAGISDWPYLAQVLEIKREWLEKGHLYSDLRYGLTSLPSSLTPAGKLAQHKRGHWGIENKLHWVRDVVFREDASLIHQANGPHVVAALRNTAIGLLRKAGHKRITAQLRYNVSQPHTILKLLGLL